MFAYLKPSGLVCSRAVGCLQVLPTDDGCFASLLRFICCLCVPFVKVSLCLKVPMFASLSLEFNSFLNFILETRLLLNTCGLSVFPSTAHTADAKSQNPWSGWGLEAVWAFPCFVASCLCPVGVNLGIRCEVCVRAVRRPQQHMLKGFSACRGPSL